MLVLKTLYLADHGARVRIRKGNVVVERSTEALRVPIETLEAVVLLGRADVSNDAIGELVRRGIRLSALSKTGRLRFSVGGPVRGNVMLRLEQCSAAQDPERTMAIARVLVAGKLQNCRRMMQRWEWDSRSTLSRGVIRSAREAVEDRITAAATARDGDSVRGVEGEGSRRYFKAMAVHLGGDDDATTFERRSRRPPRDPVNALLGFTYGMLLTEVAGALDSVGLDPQIGFLHRPRSGRPSLALDLLEELRPAVADRFVVTVLRRREVVVDDFERRAGAVYLTEDGRRKVVQLYDRKREKLVAHPLLRQDVPVALLPSVQATLLARHLRGDLADYPPFTLVA